MVTVFDPLGNFVHELFGLFEAFKVRNEDKDDSCGWVHTDSRSNTGLGCSRSLVSYFTFPLSCTSGQIKLMIRFKKKYICITVFIYMYICLYLSICVCFSWVLLNLYPFPNAMEHHSKNLSIGSGQNSALKLRAGNQWLRPRNRNSIIAEQTLGLLHDKTMDSEPLLYWFCWFQFAQGHVDLPNGERGQAFYKSRWEQSPSAPI